MNALLDILRANALESKENIAKMLNLSSAEVEAEIHDLESRGIIRGYQAIVNEDELEDQRVTAVIEVRVTPERNGGFDRIAKRVSKFPEVEAVYLMSGGFDLMIFVAADDLRAVAQFVSEKLSTIDGILSTSTHFQLKAYKRNRVLMNGESEDTRLCVSP